jgi:hypothetical protein
MDRFGQLYRPSVVSEISSDGRDTVEGMHPLRQIMIVLAVPIPFQSFAKRIAGPPFLQLLAYPQPSFGGMKPAVFLIEAADPTGSVVVVAMPSEHAVHLIDELQGQVFEFLAFRLLIKAKKVTDRESVSP